MPKLSLIVPTRERADTLVHTLRTLVEQDYQDCEILVSDNASGDGTARVVESFSDRRLRYENTGHRLSMSDNWEFALGKAQGEFISYIGDDDGFIPGAITKAMRLLDESGLSALTWDRINYNWPDYPTEGAGNWFALRTGISYLYEVESRKRLKKLLQFRDGFAFARLPGVYHGIVRRALVEKVKDASVTGAFFESIAPDVFSAIALGAVLDRYLLSEYPFSINGCSHHSTGGSLTTGKAADPDSPISKFLSEITREFDPRVKLAPAVEAGVMGEYLLVKQSLAKLQLPEPSWDRYVRALIRRAQHSPCAGEILESASHTVRAVGLKIKVPDKYPAGTTDSFIAGMEGDIMRFKAPVDIVGNVYDACRLVEGMLSTPSNGGARSAALRFLRNMNRCFISEAKSLYRSL